MYRPSVLLLVATLGATSAAAPVSAAESYDSCAGFIDTLPAVITTQGTWCMRRNLASQLTSGAAIDVKANNVTIDCNLFKLGGASAGPATAATGIRATNRSNVTVTGCNIRGFYDGVAMTGFGHKVDGNRFEGNTHRGIFVDSSPGVVRDNLVVDTGSDSQDSLSAIHAIGDVDLLGNTVDGYYSAYTVGGSPGTAGIVSEQAEGNRISGNTVRHGHGRDGIHVPTGTSVVRDNVLAGSGGVGINCGEYAPARRVIARDNQAIGYYQAAPNCAERGNDAIYFQ
jgi:hypothetical protein